MTKDHRLALIALVLGGRLTYGQAGWFAEFCGLVRLDVHICFCVFVFAFGRSFEASGSKLERSSEEGTAFALYMTSSFLGHVYLERAQMYRHQAVVTCYPSGVCPL